MTTLAFAVACATWVFTRRRLLDRAGVATVTRTRLIHSPRTFYAACVAALAVALVTASAIRRADLGRRLLAVRSNERRANTIGVSATLTKVTAFAIAGAFAASAGALLGALRVRSSPGDFGADESLRIVAVTVIGGAGTVIGAVLGAVFVLGVPAIFGDTTIAGLLPSGIGLLVLALVFPGGLADVVRRRFARLAPSRRLAPGPAQMPTRWTVKAASPAAPAGFAVRGLTVMFGGRVALDRIDFEIEPASIIGLIGPNGAGKTTLLDAVSGFVTPAAGTILMDDRPIGAMSPTARARAGIGRVLQDGRLFEDLTVAEAVTLAGRAERGAALDAIEWLGIDARTPCQDLPAGTRRLVELACTLVRQPRLLLLDEPTAGLGRADASSFAPLLSSIHEQLGCTVVLVEHDVVLVGAVASRLVCLSAGAILADGPPAEVLAHPDVVVGYVGH